MVIGSGLGLWSHWNQWNQKNSFWGVSGIALPHSFQRVPTCNASPFSWQDLHIYAPISLFFSTKPTNTTVLIISFPRCKRQLMNQVKSSTVPFIPSQSPPYLRVLWTMTTFCYQDLYNLRCLESWIIKKFNSVVFTRKRMYGWIMKALM